MGTRRSRPARRCALLATAAAAVLVLVVVGTTPAASWPYLAVEGVATAVAWWAARSEGVRSAAGLMALGITLMLLGDVVSIGRYGTSGSPGASPADLAFLGSYAALALGL